MLVTVSGQSRPEPVSNLAEPGQSRPRLYVLHGGGAECSQVPQDHLLQRGIGRQRAAKPSLGRGVSGRSAHRPNAAWRHLYKWRPGAYGLSQGSGRAIGPALGEQLAEFAESAGLFFDQRATGRYKSFDVQSDPMPAEGAFCAAFDDGLRQRAQPKAVAGGNQVNG